MHNRLYYGDNLEIMQSLARDYPHGFIDLIYIDPPFNSKRNYNILYEDMIKDATNGKRNTALKEAFKDTWSNVDLAVSLDEIKHLNANLHKILSSLRQVIDTASISYLTMMAVRIHYMHKLLKDTGSFYLHCDPTMSHYLKIICDVVFSKDNFRNEIAWKRDAAGQGARRISKQFPRNMDKLLFYSKSNQYFFCQPYTELSDKQKSIYSYADDDGRLYKNVTLGDYTQKSIETMRGKNLIHTSSTGKEYKKYYLDEGKATIDCIWTDIHGFGTRSMARERLKYPTQKPLALLERIIEASSKQGDLVADFFCGCGTAIVAAEKLKRKWLGVDISHLAVGLIEKKRLQQLKAQYQVIGFPRDLASAERLAEQDVGGRFRFQDWVIEVCLTGHSNAKKSADGGFDGHLSVVVDREKSQQKRYCLIEVKSGSTNIADLRAFQQVVQGNHSADMGIFVCFDKYATTGMRRLADEQELVESDALFKVPKLAIITVEQLLQKKYPQWLDWTIASTY